MRGHRVYGLLVAIGLMAASGNAYAGTAVIDCTNHAALYNEFTVTHPGGLAGTFYQIINGPCTGGFTITQNNIGIQGQPAPQTMQGGLLILGAQNLVLEGLDIFGGVCHDPVDCFELDGVLVRGGATVTGGTGSPYGMSLVTFEGGECPDCGIGGLRVEGASAVTADSITIQNKHDFGIFADNASNVAVYNSTIQNIAQTNAGDAAVVSAYGGASVQVSGTISGFGGFGLVAGGGSSIDFSAGTLSKGSAGDKPTIAAFDSSSVTIEQLPGSPTSVAGPDNAPTILANGHSSIFILGGSVTTSSASTAGPAIIAAHSSSVKLSGATVTGPSNNHTVLVSQGSSALIKGANITADAPFNASNQFAVIAAVHNASVELAGGNTITNNAAGGLSVRLSAGSTLEENNGTSPDYDINAYDINAFDFLTPGNDTITGNGRIHAQSVIELGALPGPYTLTWNGNISLSQASSFRADGDNVTINGAITLDEASNGYFNHFAGTSNNISSVVCKSATDHVSNPNFVTPPVTIGPPPGCALF